MERLAVPPVERKKRAHYVALAVAIVWGLLWVLTLADLARTEPFAAVWFAFGTLSCLTAIVVIQAGGQSHLRAWAWAIAAIPASFLGPLAAVLLLVPAIRRDLANARSRQPGEREPYDGPVLSRPHLAGSLVGCIGIAVAIFIGVVMLAVLGGVHRFTSHDLHVILLISALPAAGAVLVVIGRWIQRGPDARQRASIAVPMALVTQAVIWAATVWLWSRS